MAFVEMAHISKRFGSVLANDDVSIDVRRGEILALLGENGSGKSTLVNMLSGIYTPDSGSITIDGRLCAFRSPAYAIARGIGMVHQHFMLIPRLTAWENICVGERMSPCGFERMSPCGSTTGSALPRQTLASEREGDKKVKPEHDKKVKREGDKKWRTGIFINKEEIGKKIDDLKDRFGLQIENKRKVYDMSVGEKQTVEIIKMLYHGAETNNARKGLCLILDEPTAVLTPQETEHLFAVLKNMRAEGCAVIIITHKLAEVMEISDRVTVLRRGRVAGTVNTGETTPEALTAMMVGEERSLEITRGELRRSVKPLLRVENLTLAAHGGRKLLDNVCFDLYGGEILGVAGIAGSGQKELAESLTGLARASGSVKFEDEEILALSPLAIRKKGVSLNFVPEDRLGMGLAAGMSISENMLLKSFYKGRGIFLDHNEGKTAAEAVVKKYDVSTPNVNHVVRKLSGGNIQKVLLGREIEEKPRLLITAYPVRGLDIGASLFVYETLNREKAAGVGILFIGEDLDVLLALCDRIMVFHAGGVAAIVDARTATKNELGALMLGETYGFASENRQAVLQGEEGCL